MSEEVGSLHMRVTQHGRQSQLLGISQKVHGSVCGATCDHASVRRKADGIYRMPITLNAGDQQKPDTIFGNRHPTSRFARAAVRHTRLWRRVSLFRTLVDDVLHCLRSAADVTYACVCKQLPVRGLSLPAFFRVPVACPVKRLVQTSTSIGDLPCSQRTRYGFRNKP